jgi:hypothetical protein
MSGFTSRVAGGIKATTIWKPRVYLLDVTMRYAVGEVCI